jgi:hypothetical protein
MYTYTSTEAAVAATRKAQILMEPDEYRRLAAIAAAQGVSLSELVRAAVREKYLRAAPPLREAAARICAMELSIPTEWEELEQLIEGRHDAGLPR